MTNAERTDASLKISSAHAASFNITLFISQYEDELTEEHKNLLRAAESLVSHHKLKLEHRMLRDSYVRKS
jgi:hypothetical protein